MLQKLLLLLKSVEFGDDVALILSVAGLGMRPHVTP